MTSLNRRHFLQKTTIAAGGAFLGFPAFVRGQNLNSKIQVACIGVGGKGSSDVDNAAACGGQIVGLCDVDARNLNKKAEKFPDAKKFVDFRQMLRDMGSSIDAVTISTPDHLHGIATSTAMNLGKHVYCQKPLTQTVFEARELRRLATEKKLATQMGNQGSAADGLRRAVEVIQAGVIGAPRELHVWSNRPVWPQGMARPAGSNPVPDYLNWDLWLGPAGQRPYLDGVYHDFKWRGWNDFGTGALGDMACHTVNMPFRALKLGYPSAVECEMASRIYPETYPLSSRIRFEFPERDGLPPLKFWWYDGAPGSDFKPLRPYPDIVREVVEMNGSLPPSGCLVVGDEGSVFSPDDYGSKFFIKLKGDEKFIAGDDHPAAKPVPVTIPRSPGHDQEWFAMMKDGTPAYSNFEISAYLTEIILLGCIALRVGEGVKMDWDGPNMKSPNCPQAAQFVKRENRSGW
ncbi:Gfo/Idh/MocA family oxidoreductase [Luteolibacter pohnpeiensis]|uniref:Gfo/Idh/MocA family oxidoreductase n=1 Tax=Luteolibacter pohnpeiensis TaxID=454153 RepID=A0A934VU90_9BACT|nr:Gfo/Idh/MocA family oxidoreductase [Luteolibacter pohnpeiensis]MBK1882277.1 Gfo/Idh/MocA family oxidoreductase [Luteolibacter pohnpeiensis]